MVHRRIRRIPVVDSEGVLVGILSRKDLIRMLDGTAAGEEPALRAISPREKKNAGRGAGGKDHG
jgi:CBS domain-containing protein